MYVDTLGRNKGHIVVGLGHDVIECCLAKFGMVFYLGFFAVLLGLKIGARVRVWDTFSAAVGQCCPVFSPGGVLLSVIVERHSLVALLLCTVLPT